MEEYKVLLQTIKTDNLNEFRLLLQCDQSAIRSLLSLPYRKYQPSLERQTSTRNFQRLFSKLIRLEAYNIIEWVLDNLPKIKEEWVFEIIELDKDHIIDPIKSFILASTRSNIKILELFAGYPQIFPGCVVAERGFYRAVIHGYRECASFIYRNQDLFGLTSVPLSRNTSLKMSDSENLRLSPLLVNINFSPSEGLTTITGIISIPEFRKETIFPLILDVMFKSYLGCPIFDFVYNNYPEALEPKRSFAGLYYFIGKHPDVTRYFMSICPETCTRIVDDLSLRRLKHREIMKEYDKAQKLLFDFIKSNKNQTARVENKRSNLSDLD